MKKLLEIFNITFLKWSTILALAFIALYPKLPSVHITRTWVYIRLEDFVIAFLVFFWAVLFMQKKIKLPWKLGSGIFAYWIVGLASLLVSITFFGPHLLNFFPKIAALEYLRRIEYMILFFVAFSTIKSVKDVWHYLIGLVVTLVGVVMYGLGQHFYLYFWQAFPKFFEHLTFCFPSFQTGNEEFAKGIPLCLPENARITSTFGGHYDLAAFLVVVLPILFVVMIMVRKKLQKILLGILFVLGIMLLNFTASRISFVAFLIGTTATLIFIKKKKFILPVWIVSLILLFVFSGSLAHRFLQTIRVASVVTNNQGQVVGVAENSLPADLKNKISKGDEAVVANQPVPNGDVPLGTASFVLPQNNTPVATSVAVVKNSLSDAQAKKLRLQNGGLQISTVSGSFLIQKALVYDISFTTRFQGEWPHAWAAFMTFPPLGMGYSTITLATDNDYLRLLGESGFLGFLSFMAIFFMFGVFLKESSVDKEEISTKMVSFALAGGVLGLLVNAVLIDVFESSKVAESLWILLGVGAGGLSLHEKKSVPYWAYAKRILTSKISIALYLFVLTIVVLGRSLNNFFVGDDFTWLKWAATSTPRDVLHYFFDAQGFFYRPVAKLFIFGMYTFFSFEPQGYRFMTLFMHFLTGFGVFLLALKIFKNKFWAALSGALFLILQANGEDVFWIATISTNVSTLFAVYAILAYVTYREGKNVILYVLSILLSFFVLFSYEMGVILPLLIILSDIFFIHPKNKKSSLLYSIPFFVVLGIYAVMRFVARGLGSGGDYAYSIPHFIPNLVGNFFGYMAYLIFANASLPYYTMLRSILKIYALPIAGILIIGFGLLMFRYRLKLLHIKFSEQSRTYVYIFLFIFIALLPFLGLGNLSPRYGYFASVGFVIGVMLLIKDASAKFIKDQKAKSIAIGIIVTIIAVWNIWGMQVAMKEWANAGNITLNTLKVFRVYYENIPVGANIYVANLPIRKANAWVFPVGFDDALWFIYRDDSLHVNKVSPEEAKFTAAQHIHTNFVFQFDSNGNITEVQ